MKKKNANREIEVKKDYPKMVPNGSQEVSKQAYLIGQHRDNVPRRTNDTRRGKERKMEKNIKNNVRQVNLCKNWEWLKRGCGSYLLARVLLSDQKFLQVSELKYQGYILCENRTDNVKSKRKISSGKKWLE